MNTKTVFLLIAVLNLGMCQITWDIEHVDSIPVHSYAYRYCDLVLDNNERAHILYTDPEGNVCFATRTVTGWIKEVVDSGPCAYSSLSLTMDSNNVPHASYYGRDTLLDHTYLKYAYKPDSICEQNGDRPQFVQFWK
jgi:hypothetical protein